MSIPISKGGQWRTGNDTEQPRIYWVSHDLDSDDALFNISKVMSQIGACWDWHQEGDEGLMSPWLPIQDRISSVPYEEN